MRSQITPSQNMTFVAFLLACALQCSGEPAATSTRHESDTLLPAPQEQDGSDQLDDEVEWILVEEPPREPPVALLRGSETSSPHGDRWAPGQLVMVRWIIDGEPVIRGLELPIVWQPPVEVGGETLTIDLGTPVAPIEVETRLFRSLDEQGLPRPPSPAIWCKYLDPAAPCRLVRENEDDNWHVVVDLPQAGTTYISLRGSWGFPADSPLQSVTDWFSLDAAWVFAVNTK